MFVAFTKKNTASAAKGIWDPEQGTSVRLLIVTSVLLRA